MTIFTSTSHRIVKSLPYLRMRLWKGRMWWYILIKSNATRLYGIIFATTYLTCSSQFKRLTMSMSVHIFYLVIVIGLLMKRQTRCHLFIDEWILRGRSKVLQPGQMECLDRDQWSMMFNYSYHHININIIILFSHTRYKYIKH